MSKQSGEHIVHCPTEGPCPNVATLSDHEDRIRQAERSLSQGDTRFTRLEGQLGNVSEKLGELSDTIKGAIRWLLGIAGTAAAGGILWAIVQSKGAGL